MRHRMPQRHGRWRRCQSPPCLQFSSVYRHCVLAPVCYRMLASHQCTCMLCMQVHMAQHRASVHEAAALDCGTNLSKSVCLSASPAPRLQCLPLAILTARAPGPNLKVRVRYIDTACAADNTSTKACYSQGPRWTPQLAHEHTWHHEPLNRSSGR